MQAIVYHGQRDVRIGQVPDPEIREATDAVVRIERTAICGSDLHFYHAASTPAPGFAMGHEFLGTVEDIGSEVRRFRRGDRVLVSCTIGCGACSHCGDALYSGCRETAQLGPLTNFLAAR